MRFGPQECLLMTADGDRAPWPNTPTHTECSADNPAQPPSHGDKPRLFPVYSPLCPGS